MGVHAARLLNHSFRCRNAQEWEGRGVGDLYGRLRYLTDKGLYGDYILAHYTHEEIAMAEDFLCRNGTSCSPTPALTCCSNAM